MDTTFPTEVRRELRRLAKGKRPAAGDAEEGLRITPEQAAELREQLIKIAQEQAARKKRQASSTDYQHEYGEFNAYFHLSSYQRLPVAQLAEAREYLERKLYARRQADGARLTRQRYVAGIKAVQKELKMSDDQYRQLLRNLGNCSSTTQMEMATLRRVFEHFRELQGKAIVNKRD